MASASNVFVPTPNELMPATGRVAAGPQTRIARPFFPTAPDVGQHHGFDRNQRNAIFRQPFVRGFERMIEILVASFLEETRRFDFFGDKVFVLEHRESIFRKIQFLSHNILLNASRYKKSNTLT